MDGSLVSRNCATLHMVCLRLPYGFNKSLNQSNTLLMELGDGQPPPLALGEGAGGDRTQMLDEGVDSSQSVTRNRHGKERLRDADSWRRCCLLLLMTWWQPPQLKTPILC